MSTRGLRKCPRVDTAENGHLWNKFERSLHMDLADVHAWTLPRSTRGRCAKSLVWAPKKNFIFLKKYWLMQDLNSSLLRGDPVYNQLDHRGQLESQNDYFWLYLQFIKSEKNWTSRGPRRNVFWWHQRRPYRTSLQKRFNKLQTSSFSQAIGDQ
jgi:hypothetical protein